MRIVSTTNINLREEKSCPGFRNVNCRWGKPSMIGGPGAGDHPGAQALHERGDGMHSSSNSWLFPHLPASSPGVTTIVKAGLEAIRDS
jgi:hypothetical protein